MKHDPDKNHAWGARGSWSSKPHVLEDARAIAYDNIGDGEEPSYPPCGAERLHMTTFATAKNLTGMRHPVDADRCNGK
jgi:hypothetical protein